MIQDSVPVINENESNFERYSKYIIIHLKKKFYSIIPVKFEYEDFQLINLEYIRKIKKLFHYITVNFYYKFNQKQIIILFMIESKKKDELILDTEMALEEIKNFETNSIKISMIESELFFQICFLIKNREKRANNEIHLQNEKGFRTYRKLWKIDDFQEILNIIITNINEIMEIPGIEINIHLRMLPKQVLKIRQTNSKIAIENKWNIDVFIFFYSKFPSTLSKRVNDFIQKNPKEIVKKFVNFNTNIKNEVNEGFIEMSDPQLIKLLKQIEF